MIPAVAGAAYVGRVRGVNAWFIGGAATVAAIFAAWRITTPTPEEFEYFQPLSSVESLKCMA